jgi:hypothetical protein
MIRATLRDIVAKAVAALQEDGELPSIEAPGFAIEQALSPADSTYVTDVALKLVAALQAAGGQPDPHALAEMIAARIRETVEVVPAYDLIGAVEVDEVGRISLRVDLH